MDYQIQVVTVPVTDVDQAAAFYTQQAGFALVYRPAGGFRVVQLTPPGSACSVQFGVGDPDAAPGSARGTYLAVTDIEAARCELAERGVKVSAIRHKSPVHDWKGGWQPGTDPKRRDYAEFAEFADRTATPGSSRRSATAGRLALGASGTVERLAARLRTRGGETPPLSPHQVPQLSQRP